MSSVVRTTTGTTITASADGAGNAGEMAHPRHHDLIDEQANDNRRRAEQDVVDETHHLGELRVASVFRHIGAGEDAERRADRDAQNRDDETADNRVERPPSAPGGGVFWVKTASESPAKPAKSA